MTQQPSARVVVRPPASTNSVTLRIDPTQTKFRILIHEGGGTRTDGWRVRGPAGIGLRSSVAALGLRGSAAGRLMGGRVDATIPLTR